jgi:hypothetical protein
MITTGSWNAGGRSDPSPTQSIAISTLWSEAAFGGGARHDAAGEASMSCAESGWNAVKDSGCGAVVTPVGADGTLEEMLFGRGWEEGGFSFESDVLRL